MRTTAIARLVLLGLWAALIGCAPIGSAEPVTLVEGPAQDEPRPSARSTSPAEADLSRTPRTSLGRPSSSRSALRPRSDGEAAGAPVGDPEIQDAEWTMSIQPDAILLIQHKGAPVIKAEYISWAELRPQIRWVISRFRVERGRGGPARLTGDVPDLSLKCQGTIEPVADNALRLEYRFHAAMGHDGIKGTILDWKLDLKSPSFGGKVSDPVILEDKTGWKWPVGPNQAIVVQFDQPLDKIIFERNQKDNIRTFFFADRISPGEKRISYTVRLPEGGRIAPSAEERYGPTDTTGWFRDALSWDGSPIDLSFLNAQERPAGRHGFLKAEGDHLIFEDGTTMRFWGANLVANALFSTPRENIAPQAHRMAQLGFNLMRIHQHDAKWATRNIFAGHGEQNTRHLDPQSLDSLDWWIKCLKDEGIYIWLDLNYQRALTPGDGVKVGADEIQRRKGLVAGFSYFNHDVLTLMQEFQHQLLNHVNRYTHLAYKDDPAIVGLLITNENDVTNRYGNLMLPARNNPAHNALFTTDYKAFARKHNLPPNRVFETWLPGPSKLYLAEVEHRFNRSMIQDFKGLGVKAPIATTNLWSRSGLFALPPLADSDILDVHSYGIDEALNTNPRYEPNFISWIGMAQVQDKPLSITEWNLNYPGSQARVDRFTAPLYLASIASLQGWDMPMLYNYAHVPLRAPGQRDWERKIVPWSTYIDPAVCGIMPAAAMAFRQGHISPARMHFCLMPNPAQFFGEELNPITSATLRTLVEQSRLTVGLPAAKELPWIKPTQTLGDATIVTDPHRDFIPSGKSFVRSDTGELLRNWTIGIQTIDTPKTQAVSGWVGGKTLSLGDATFRIDTPKAVVALTSIDNQPLSSSRYILITTVARAVANTPNRLPFLSEPVVGTITFRAKAKGLQLLALGSRGTVQERLTPPSSSDGITIRLPTHRGTHWYALRAGEQPSSSRTRPGTVD